MTPEQSTALRLARLMIDNGVSTEEAVNNPVIPESLREFVRETLASEAVMILAPARMLVADATRDEWLKNMDRSGWYYWPTLRDYLLVTKEWDAPSVRSLDQITNRILGQLAPPDAEQFDIRGLVLGFVQSGKTANFTALIGKAADVGYRLVIVLSGTDKGLRRQTQIRLNRELVGYADRRSGAVNIPPMGNQWHQFTNEDLDGDFRPGLANFAALQGSQPVLLVVKKNGHVLRRLHTWLDEAPAEIRRNLPVLVIDDEADQASVDTRGSRQTEAESQDDLDYEPPSVINGLIRDLLQKFNKCSYVAYTATPFANILIPHDTVDPTVGNDLYPRDFIVDLPKPAGYFGAEELFGRMDRATGDTIEGLDVVRDISDEDVLTIEQNGIPESLELALIDFVLSGAARARRGHGSKPATMLVHTGYKIAGQRALADVLSQRFGELRDEWRYHRERSIKHRLQERWSSAFRPITRVSHPDMDVPFSEIEAHMGPFFESVEIRVINSDTGEVLDYDREPSLKAIAIGGNRLARGLTLEGLAVSYFVRRTVMYDTLMQMGRWFGFRAGYEDLTRIYMTRELAGWFSNLAMVEHELRQDIQVYENENLNPLQLGVRILQHPSMLVTSRLKQRFSSAITVDQSYSGQILQTVRFPFSHQEVLRDLLNANLDATRKFVQNIGEPKEWKDAGPVWTDVTLDQVLDFLLSYRIDPSARSISVTLLRAYLERQAEVGEVSTWSVAIKGREITDRNLGQINLGLSGSPINLISRTRLVSDSDSLGVITSPGDELEGLSEEEIEKAESLRREKGIGINPAARLARSEKKGLLLLYPVSRYSGVDITEGGARRALFDDPTDSNSRDLIALAISLPHSDKAQKVTGQYVIGSVDWRPV